MFPEICAMRKLKRALGTLVRFHILMAVHVVLQALAARECFSTQLALMGCPLEVNTLSVSPESAGSRKRSVAD